MCSMRKRSIFLLVLGFAFIILSFVFNCYSMFRILALALGIFLSTLSLVFHKNKNILLIIIFPILLISISYGLDILLYSKFNRIPIYVYEIKSSDKVSTYNSFFYRIFNCNQNLVLDYGYKKDYVCTNDDLNVLDINTFLANPHESLEKYSSKFVRIHGKISKITGLNELEMSSYTLSDVTLNGYVNFNLNFAVSAKVKEELKNYRIYDYVDIIGRVDNLIEENDKKVIILVDAKLIASNIYDEYSYEIIKDSSNTKLTNLVDNYYLYGIKEINIKYDVDNVYSLSYLLTDNRITWETLTNDKDYEIIKDKEEKEIAKKYNLDKFNLVECSNKKIFVNKAIRIDDNICDVKISDK